jgi:transposase InsO family protein
MRHFGLSSKVLYHWLNRFDELDLTSLEDRSRRPHTLRTKQYTATQASRMQQLHYDKPLVERFNGILQQEFVNLGNFHPDPDEFNPDLTEWLIYYNFVRPHHSLGLKRPAEFANMKAARVLPMWSPITKPSRIEQESV